MGFANDAIRISLESGPKSLGRKKQLGAKESCGTARHEDTLEPQFYLPPFCHL